MVFAGKSLSFEIGSLNSSFEAGIPLSENDSPIYNAPFSLIYISLRLIMNRKNAYRHYPKALGAMALWAFVVSVVKLIPIDWLRTTLIVLATVVTFIYGSFYISKKD
jgi:hypothetical protein